MTEKAAADGSPAGACTSLGSRKRKAITPDADEAPAVPPNQAVLLSLLECPVCYNTMLPPIRQCSEGHNFCDKCCQRLMNSSHDSARKCPSCRARLRCPVSRARNLEVWATESAVEIECDHAPCKERFPYGRFAEHKATCIGQTVQCPKRCCAWRGEPSSLAVHLRSDEPGHGLKTCLVPARYSNRHADYSTTVIFETRRKHGDTRRWCPPRQLIEIPANPTLGTVAVTFCVAMWKPAGMQQPIMAAIQALRPSTHEELPFSYDLSVSAYPRPPASQCVSRMSAVGPVPELGIQEVWRRPALCRVCSPVLVADHSALQVFNTVGLGPLCDAVQRYELHVRLTPITTDRHPDPEMPARMPVRRRHVSAGEGERAEHVRARALPYGYHAIGGAEASALGFDELYDATTEEDSQHDEELDDDDDAEDGGGGGDGDGDDDIESALGEDVEEEGVTVMGGSDSSSALNLSTSDEEALDDDWGSSQRTDDDESESGGSDDQSDEDDEDEEGSDEESESESGE